MKSIFTLLLACGALGTAAQTIRIADNNANRPTGANIYSTLQAAIDAAQPDDIVYLTPSTTTYGDATVGKRITIKGVGFGITEISPRASILGVLTIVNSSNGTDNVSGLVLTGFTFTTISFAAGSGSTPYNNILADNLEGANFNITAVLPSTTNNLVIKNCFINRVSIGVNGSVSTNMIIRNNIISDYVEIANSSNPVVSNNLFFNNSYSFHATSTSTGVRVEHNIFSGSGNAFANLVNGMVTNNIFYGKVPNGSSPFHSNTLSNNLVLSTYTFPPANSGGPANSGVNNLTGTGPLFTNAPVSTSYNSTYNYTLQAGSPCIGTASTGDNIGPSGGLYPWTGILTLKATAVPVITQFGNSGAVPQNQPLKSNVKAKSN